MLTHLNLINFALADNLAIDIEQGFNVLTGETGAGKSLLLDALSACLGERTDTNYVRYGSEKADVTAVFSYQEQSPEAEWLKTHELDDESGEIHLRRVIFATGRSKAWINGRPSSLSELKEIGRLLVNCIANTANNNYSNLLIQNIGSIVIVILQQIPKRSKTAITLGKKPFANIKLH